VEMSFGERGDSSNPDPRRRLATRRTYLWDDYHNN